MASFARIARDRISGPRLAVTVAAAILAAAAAQAQTVDIGSVAAANEDVIGTPPAADRRQLTPGVNLLLYERIETSDVGAGQFLFLDQTSMTVWPNSDVVLDEYVYDPDRGSGEMALSMTRGVLRFIGGQISKDDDVTLRTQHAVVAVRGGIAQISVDDSGTEATLIAGDYVRITGLDGQRPLTLSRSGARGIVRAGEPAPEFLGVGGEDETAALYGAPAGEGDGGATQEVSDATVEPLIEGEVTALGSGDRRAPTRRPVSTRGEAFAETSVAEDDQLALAVTDDRAEAVTEDSAQEAIENETAETRIPGATGARFGVADGGVFTLPDGTVIEDPAARNIVFTGQGFGAIGSASRGVGGLTATDADGDTIAIPDTPGFSVLRDADGAVIGQSFVAPDGDFALQARTGSRFLDFFGAPTPASVWTDDAAPVRVYDLSDELFTLAGLPLPASTGAIRFDANVSDAPLGGDLLLIPQAGGPVVGDPANGLGFANSDPQVSKWLLGFLDIRGTGAGQTSALGALTGQAVTDAAGQPTLNASLTAGAALDALATPSRVDAPFGVAPGADGAAIFGAGGEYFVLGNLNPFAQDADPDVEAAPAALVRFADGAGFSVERYGDTRLAVLAQTLRPADRLPLAAALADDAAARAAFAAAPTPPDHGFDGGFAATAGFGMQGTRRVESYLLATAAAADVQVGFDIGANSVAVLLRDLDDPFGGSRAAGGALSFGDRRGAYLDDGAFAARQAPGATAGSLDRDGPSLGGRSGGFRGQLASAGLVGDGGVFPGGVDTAPDALRWGWWGGSFEFGAQPDPALDGRVDHLHLGSFVTGVQADAALVGGLTDVATFDGFAVGHVLEQTPDGPASYVDGAAFALSYDLGRRAGRLTLTDLIGQTFAADVASLPLQPASAFAGVFDGLDGDVSVVRGGFFAAGADEIAAAAGGFTIETTALSGALARITGVFGGDKTSFGPPLTAPLPDFLGAGASVAAGETATDSFGRVVPDAGAANIVVAGARDADYADHQTVLAADGVTILSLEARASAGDPPAVAIPGFREVLRDAGEGVDRRPLVIDGVTVGTVLDGFVRDEFYISAQAFDDGARRLDFGGAPTAPSVWAAPSGDTVAVRVYGLGEALFTDALLPLPLAANVFAETEINAGSESHSPALDSFYLIPQANGPLIGDPAQGFGDANGGREDSRVAYAYLALRGQGAAQQSSFGAFVDNVFTTEAGQPSFNAAALTTTQLDAAGDPVDGRAPYGPLDAGVGQTFFGPDGQNAVLGNVLPYAPPGDPGLDPVFATFGDTRFGDTRVLDLEPTRGFTLGPDRAPLGVAPQDSALAQRLLDTATPDAVFDGGFAAVAAPNGPNGPTLLGNTGAGDVRFGFDVEATSAVAEFEGLVGGATGDIVNVVLGDFERSGALIDDRRFVMRDNFERDGALTGLDYAAFQQDLAAPGLAGPVDAATAQNAFRGSLASFGLVGDGGIFPTGVDTDPQNLRAGWWSGVYRFDAAPDVTLHLGSFVTGVQGDLSQMSALSGVATYSGFAIAHVLEDLGGGATASYVDGGGFTLSYDLFTQSGDVTLTDIVGLKLGGSVGLDGDTLFGGLSSDTGALSGSAQAVFFAGSFGGADDETAALAGGFDLSGAIPGGNPVSVLGTLGADKTVFDPAAGQQPLTGFAGAAFFAAAQEDFTDAFGGQITDAGLNNFVLTPTGRDPLSPFTVAQEPGGTVFRAFSTTFGDSVAFFPDDAADPRVAPLTDAPLLDASGVELGHTVRAAIDQAFFLEATRFDSGDRSLTAFGEVTPPSVWAAPATDTVTVRVYETGRELFTGGLLPLPEALNDQLAAQGVTANNSRAGFTADAVLFVPQTNAPLIGDPADGFGYANSGNRGDSKIAQGYLAFAGEGVAQSSALAVLTGDLTNTEAGQPNFLGTMRGRVRVGGDPDTGGNDMFLDYTLADNGAGETVFGADGRNAVMLNGANYLTRGVNDLQAASGGVGGDRFGDTRLLDFNPALDVTLAAADRLTLAGDPTATPLDFSLVDADVEGVFNGGFAAATRTSPLGVQNVTTGLAGDVRFGFDVDRTGLAAEFVGLGGDTLLFGGYGFLSALLDDDRFVARDNRDATGALSGAPLQALGSTGQPDNADGRQRAFRGALASSGYVGDGGVFPAGVDTDPKFLRWGWWNGSFRFSSDESDPTLNDQRAAYHLGMFVTGVQADLSVVQGLTGSATYDGFAVANVIVPIDPGAAALTSYVDAGAFSMTYDFSDRAGAAFITGIFEDVSFDLVEVTGVPGLAFSGSLTEPLRGGDFGSLSGAFFADGDDQSAAVAGSFRFGADELGLIYDAAGVFGADRSAFFNRTITSLNGLGLRATQYVATSPGSFVSASGLTVDDPAGRRLVIDDPERDQNFFALDLSRVADEALPEPLVRAFDNGSGASFDIPEVAGFVARVGPDGPESIFGEIDAFYLRAADAGNRVSVDIVGLPTPQTVWEAPAAATGVDVRVYNLSDELLTQRTLPLPQGTPFDSDFLFADLPAGGRHNGELLLIPQLDGPVVADPAPLGTPILLDASTQKQNSRWMLGALGVLGQGPGQETALTVMTGRVLTNSRFGADDARTPALSAAAQTTARYGGQTATLQATTPYALLTDLNGASAFGDAGEFLVLGNAVAVGQPDNRIFLNAEPATFTTGLPDGSPAPSAYGDSRLAVLSDILPTATVARLPLALQFFAIDGFPDARDTVEFGLNAGFAATTATTFSGGGSTPYLLVSGDSQSVRFGFNVNSGLVSDPDLRTGVAAEFAGLREPFAVNAIDDVTVTFGGFNDRSALLDDRAFAALDTDDGDGVISNAVVAVNEGALARPVDTDRADGDDAFRGQLASAGLVGDGGVFEAGVDTDPEYLRWGWWGGRVAYNPGDPTFGDTEEQLHLGSFVTGVRSDIADVRALTGAATFEGHAVGHVLESDGAQYVDGGRYKLDYDLTAETGTATISQILGQSVETEVTGLTEGTTHYAGVLPGGAIRGAFFRGDGGPLDAVSATAGSFEYQATAPSGNAAQVVGVFGADRTGHTPP